MILAVEIVGGFFALFGAMFLLADRLSRASRGLVLNSRDFAAFQQALDNPPEPNAALRSLMKDHSND